MMKRQDQIVRHISGTTLEDGGRRRMMMMMMRRRRRRKISLLVNQ